MEPWQSWAVVVLGGGAAWYYYNSQGKPRDRTKRPDAGGKRADSRPSRQREDGGRARRARDGSEGSRAASGSDIPEVRHAASSSSLRSDASDQPRKRKGDPKQANKSPLSSAVEPMAGVSSEADLAEEDDVDNREFAKQLAGVKKGTTLAPPPSSGALPRTLKQSRSGSSASHLAPVESTETSANLHEQSTTSSTTGADADDDLSPAVSPSLKAAAAAAAQGQTSTGGDVSDMLEAPGAGPSVLKLTDPLQPPRAQRQREQKNTPPPLTKKQRQNQRKREDEKRAREEEEGQRRQLLEKQKRLVREAEGRPARNGIAMTSKPPASSAWQGSAPATTGTAPSAGAVNGGALLDTFEEDETVQTRAAPTTKANGGAAAKGNTDSNGPWERELPSEEDQMRMINEMDDAAGWNTVPKGKKKNKKPAETSGSNTSTKQSSEIERKEDTSATAFSGTGIQHAADSDWAVV